MRFQNALLVSLGLGLFFSFNTGFAAEVDCNYDLPEIINYEAEFVSVNRTLRVDDGEKFRVKAYVKNTGNVPWFSKASGCGDAKMFLGTDNERDHESLLYAPGIKKEDNNWEKANRVSMDQERVDPDQIASFTFWTAIEEDGEVHKEFFTPVVDGLKWLDESKFSFEVIVGEAEEEKDTLRKKLQYFGESGSVLDLDLDAERKLTVDISEQKLKIMLGDTLVKELLVSTGASDTPTPVGNYSIQLKQDVRVGGKAPHYIMPNFMLFKDGGYGFHALPSLRTDGGTFWNEAREHIGIPVSHGCIRLLPEDADFVYDFTDVGTKVSIQK